MNAAVHSQPEVDAIVDLVVDCHARGRFIRDPSPSVIALDGERRPTIAESDLEIRSHGDIPQLSLGQLWGLIPDWPVKAKLDAAKRYAERRRFNVDLDRALRQFTANQVERCLHDNRDFKLVQSGGLVWHVRRSLFRDSHAAILADPDRFLAPGTKLLKDGTSTTVAIGPGDALIKRFNLKKYRTLVKHHFAPSRAQAAFQRARHLEMSGIPTPRAIAFADRKLFGWVYRSYILTEFIPGANEIDRACRDWSWCDETVRHRSLTNVGRLVGLLHDAGFANRDLKARNVLISGSGEAWLIDLDGLRAGERVNPETRLKNLRRMVRDLKSFESLTLRDRLRFLRAYAAAVRDGSAADYFRKLEEEPW